MPVPQHPAYGTPVAERPLSRARLDLTCSKPGCSTTYRWLGAFGPDDDDRIAAQRGQALAAAADLGWTFPPTGNVCPRPHEERT